jgi:hypothetical protein
VLTCELCCICKLNQSIGCFLKEDIMGIADIVFLIIVSCSIIGIGVLAALGCCLDAEAKNMERRKSPGFRHV